PYDAERGERGRKKREEVGDFAGRKREKQRERKLMRNVGKEEEVGDFVGRKREKQRERKVRKERDAERKREREGGGSKRSL
ncbi:hypothetical protein Taro_042336, partial [Colocasia esculenta]|nr:hypothetical protein [Colocasia esculenta]